MANEPLFDRRRVDWPIALWAVLWLIVGVLIGQILT